MSNFKKSVARAHFSSAGPSIKVPLPQMREETMGLAEQAISKKRRVYALVNNRTEGSAPRTVQAIFEMLAVRRAALKDRSYMNVIRRCLECLRRIVRNRDANGIRAKNVKAAKI